MATIFVGGAIKPEQYSEITTHLNVLSTIEKLVRSSGVGRGGQRGAHHGRLEVILS